MSSVSSSSESKPLSYDELLSANTHLKQEYELIKFKFEQLQQYVFGKRSEKHYPESPEQERLFNAEAVQEPAEEEDDIEVKGYKRRRRSKKSIPKDLPVDEVVYEPEEKACASCGAELKEFSRDVREEVEFEPARFFKRQIVTVHCSCPKCNKVHSGEAPAAVIPGSEVGPGFLGHLITSRILDHLPYYRQSKMYEREGVFIPDKALSRYGLAVGLLLEPIWKEIKRELLKLSYLQADETHLNVLDHDKASNIHHGQLWVLNDPLGPLSYYEYHKGRDKEAAGKLLGTFEGSLQTDAYAAYNEHIGIRLGCMVHARRYFVKASKVSPKESNCVLKLIAKLYRVEKEIKKKRKDLSDSEWYELRKKARQKDSIPILEKLQEYLVQLKGRWIVEQHPMYEAINYMLNRFESFTLYTTDGKFEIDNNDVERMIRPIAIGRRNWLFAGSHHSAKMAAVMMTVVHTCNQLKINPQKYLSDVLPQLASQKTTSIKGLSPLDWKQN